MIKPSQSHSHNTHITQHHNKATLSISHLAGFEPVQNSFLHDEPQFLPRATFVHPQVTTRVRIVSTGTHLYIINETDTTGPLQYITFYMYNGCLRWPE